MKIIETFILILFIINPFFVLAEYTNKEIENFQKAYEATVGIKVSKEEAKILLEESESPATRKTFLKQLIQASRMEVSV